MHRVELKVGFLRLAVLLSKKVPNAPCGVERTHLSCEVWGKVMFLMHRVELKVALQLHPSSR